MVDDWVKQAEALKVAEATELLKSTQAMVLKTIRAGQYTYDAQDLLNKAEKNMKLVTNGNPIHNLAFSKDLLKRVNDLVLEGAQEPGDSTPRSRPSRSRGRRSNYIVCMTHGRGRLSWGHPRFFAFTIFAPFADHLVDIVF